MNIQQLTDLGHRSKYYVKDAVVYEPGFHPRYVYFIKSGEVRMVTVSEEGKEFIQGIFKTGQYFGEPALLIKKPYLAYTIANTDTELILVEEDSFLKLLKTDPEFSMRLIQVLSNRLFYKSMMLEELANEKAAHRLLTLIRYLGTDLGKGDVIKATRQEIADMTGLRVETVIREIKHLVGQGSIKLIKGKIVKSW